MRELRVRAWSLERKCYVDVLSIAFNDEGLPSLLEFEYGGLLCKEPAHNFVIEQDTGLKDKNGTKIHEGDVLESTWNCDKAVVVWNDVEGEWQHYADFNTHSKYSGSVIIGNIHENSELVEGAR